MAEEYFGERGTEGMKVAVFMVMLPKDMPEMLCQMGKVGEALRYQEVRGKVIAVAGHTAKVRIPVPKKETGIQKVESWSWGGMEGDVERGWGGGEVDALGKGFTRTKCHRYGGLGKFARECSTPAALRRIHGKRTSTVDFEPLLKVSESYIELQMISHVVSWLQYGYKVAS